jgi:RHS repeat-associated protein
MNKFQRQWLNQYLRSLIVSALVLAISVIPSFAANKVFFYHTDAAGTPVAMSDASGEVVWKADYMPFGEEHEISGNVKNKNRFIGKEKDEETDLYYFGARYLDARTGRFIKPDPIGIREADLLNPQRLNRYSYSLNNPYRYVDPDGKKVRFTHNATTTFKKQFTNVINYLNRGKVSGIIATIEKNPQTIYIKEASNPHDFYYDPNAKTIVFDPTSGLEVSPGNVQTPALGVLHEAGHALQDLQNPAQMQQDVATPVPAYHNKEEHRVIDKIETPAAQKLGEPTRKHHGGKPISVSCPTCVK